PSPNLRSRPDLGARLGSSGNLSPSDSGVSPGVVYPKMTLGGSGDRADASAAGLFHSGQFALACLSRQAHAPMKSFRMLQTTSSRALGLVPAVTPVAPDSVRRMLDTQSITTDFQ